MLGAGGCIVAIVALVLNIVGVAIPYWYYYAEIERGVKASLYFGLWKLCIKAEAFGQTGTGCREFDEFKLRLVLPTEMAATRGLELTAIVMIATAILVAGVKVVAKKGDDRNFKVAGGISCTAGILMIIGAVIFSTSDGLKNLIDIPNLEIPFKLHAGFALCVVSGVLSIASGIMHFMEGAGDNQTVPFRQQHPGQLSVVSQVYPGQAGAVANAGQNPTAAVITTQHSSAIQTF